MEGDLMHKKQLVTYIAIFNVLIIVAFIFSNTYMWNYLYTEINELSGNKGQGNFVIPYILYMNGFEVTIGHDYWSDNLVNMGPIPTGIPNYPFIIFWVSIVGNLGLMALVLGKWIHEEK